MPQDATKSITEVEPFPVLKNILLTTKRTTFENLINRITEFESDDSSTAAPSKLELICNENDDQTLHPQLVANCEDLKSTSTLNITTKKKKTISFKINSSRKENHIKKALGGNRRGERRSLKTALRGKEKSTTNELNKTTLNKRKRTARIVREQTNRSHSCDNSRPTTETAITELIVPPNKRKRTNIMSLYERRFQSEESRANQQSVLSNGFLGSSGRNSSSAAGTVVTCSSSIHPDASNDISQQYYMPASTTTTAAAAPTANASAMAANSNNNNDGTPNYALSMATLCNIGNTCYLNSVVYTLRFAPQFVHNLHHLIVDLNHIQQKIGKRQSANNKSSSLGRNVNGEQIENARSWSSKDLASYDSYNNTALTCNNSAASNVSSTETQKSSQQVLTEKLHELYQNLHRNELAESAEPYHADILLHAIQDVSSIFEGNQQQDAHEFLMCVLNSIRETSQTLIKAISDYPDIMLDGCISCIDQTDSKPVNNKDVRCQNSQTQSGGNGSGNNSSSSLSTSNITKASFFTRKSKRKEDLKNSKNQRLQSPLKESGTQAHSGVSNSLFYLNTVDLTASNSKQQQQEKSPTVTSTTSLPNNSNILQLDQSQLSAEERGESSVLKEKERIREKIRQLGLDFFRDDFEGITVSTTKCLSCETITEQKESMIDIAVPVPISGFDNADYMEKSTSFIQNSCITREYFRGDNKYRCEKCTGYTEAIRSISYEVLPRLLVIQLSRFSGGMEKINSYIPTSFTLQCFCAKCCELSDGNKLHIYKLYSVITHVGATMSVGHYIAYTCSLDWANEYINCPKDLRTHQQCGSPNAANSIAMTVGAAANVATPYATNQSAAPSAASSAASALASSGTSLMKKMKFGRSKASSSGDVSKNPKAMNDVTASRMITNGIGQLSMNSTCQSIRCCATNFRGISETSNSNGQSTVSQTPQASLTLTNSTINSATLYANNNNKSDLMIDESLENGSFTHHLHHQSNSGSSYNLVTSSSATSSAVGYGSVGRGGVGGGVSKNSQSSSSSSPPAAALNTSTEPIWYMCDDDKIKAMTQREFEDLLSPSRKITITPYLLFYARIDLQTDAMMSYPVQLKQTQSPHGQTWAGNDVGGGGGGSGSLIQRVLMDKM